MVAVVSVGEAICFSLWPPRPALQNKPPAVVEAIRVSVAHNYGLISVPSK